MVCVCSFRSHGRAARFARLWASRVGVSVAVRRQGSLFAVSVPVTLRSSRHPRGFGFCYPVSGLGVRGFFAAVGAAGLRSC